MGVQENESVDEPKDLPLSGLSDLVTDQFFSGLTNLYLIITGEEEFKCLLDLPRITPYPINKVNSISYI